MICAISADGVPGGNIESVRMSDVGNALGSLLWRQRVESMEVSPTTPKAPKEEPHCCGKHGWASSKCCMEATSEVYGENTTGVWGCYHWRQNALERRFKEASKIAEKTNRGLLPPKKGDLVKPRRLDQDHQKPHKLEPRWEGRYGKVTVQSSTDGITSKTYRMPWSW